MAKLTDLQRKRIIAAHVANGVSQRKLAAKYGVSATTIRRVLKGDAQLAQKVAQKKEENTASILSFMDTQKNDVCDLLKNLLAAINDPKKIEATCNDVWHHCR